MEINSIIEYQKSLERLTWLELQNEVRILGEREAEELLMLAEVIQGFENDWNIN